MNQALGEAMETQSWLNHARSCGYLDEDEYRELDESWSHIGVMLRRMIQRADSFCKTDS